MAVVEASSCGSDSTPSLGTSICHGWGPKKTRKKIKNVSGDSHAVVLGPHLEDETPTYGTSGRFSIEEYDNTRLKEDPRGLLTGRINPVGAGMEAGARI